MDHVLLPGFDEHSRTIFLFLAVALALLLLFKAAPWARAEDRERVRAFLAERGYALRALVPTTRIGPFLFTGKQPAPLTSMHRVYEVEASRVDAQRVYVYVAVKLAFMPGPDLMFLDERPAPIGSIRPKWPS